SAVAAPPNAPPTPSSTAAARRPSGCAARGRDRCSSSAERSGSAAISCSLTGLNPDHEPSTDVVSPLLSNQPIRAPKGRRPNQIRRSPFPTMSRRRIALLTATAALAAPATAAAGPLVASAPDCSAQSASQVFLPWADVASYVLAPGGAAESANGWTLTGGAAIAPGNEPSKVHGAADASSLSAPPGATATTATMCVSIQDPGLRFFVASSLGGQVKVESLYETASGDV